MSNAVDVAGLLDTPTAKMFIIVGSLEIIPELSSTSGENSKERPFTKLKPHRTLITFTVWKKYGNHFSSHYYSAHARIQSVLSNPGANKLNAYISKAHADVES